jgi:DNA-binding SARP family transcriptional activator/biotin operon repressor
LDVKLFGSLELRRSNGVPLALQSKVARSLLAYVLTHRERSHARERLAGIFWPDLPEQQARRRLSQALWRIGETLGNDCLSADAFSVGWNPNAPIQLDLERFERAFVNTKSEAISPSSLHEAVTAYRGEFLEGIDEDWVLEARERYSNAFLTGLEQLAKTAESNGEFERALELARRVVALEPLREQAHREVMRLCLILGRPREALEQYEHCRSITLDELGEEPSSLTRALYQRVQIGETAPERTNAPLEISGTLPLVGRERERGLLLERLELARNGHGGLVLLEGEPGLGKTRLLTEIAQDAAWRGFEVRWGQGREWIALEPYALVREVIETGLTPLRAELLAQRLDGVWLREAGRVIARFNQLKTTLGSSVTLTPEHEGARLREAMVQTMLALGGLAPQLVVFDDLQWADEASLELLSTLTRRVQGAPILVVISYRPEESRERGTVWNTLQTIDREPGQLRVALGALSSTEAAQLVRRALGSSVETPLERRIGIESQGNPLLVLETLRALIENGGLEAGGQAELPLPASVREVIVARLTRLAPPIRAVLDAAAVIGSSLDIGLCSAASGQSNADTLVALDQLVRRGFLLEDESGLRFGHDKLRQIVYAELLEGDRRDLHRAIGQALETRDSQAFEVMARHFDEAGVWDKALEYHRRSAERASKLYDFAGALTHLDRAVTLGDSVGISAKQRFELLSERVNVLRILDRRPEHLTDLLEMEQLALGDAPRLGRVRCDRARLMVALGQFEESDVLARSVLEDARQREDQTQKAEALEVLAILAMRSGRRAEAIPLRREIVEAHRASGDIKREAAARRSLAQTLMLTQQLEEANREVRAALEMHRRLGDQLALASDVSVLGHIWRFRGHLRRAASCYQFDLETCRSIGNRSGQGSCLINLAQVSARLGQVGQAMRCYTQAIEVFTAINDPEGEASARYNLAGLQAGWLGDHRAAQTNLERAREFFERVNDHNGLAYCLLIESESALERNELTQARTLLNHEIIISQTTQNRWLGGQYEITCAELEIREGQPDQALERLGRAEQACRTLGLEALLLGIGTARADALLALGKSEEALAVIEALLADGDFNLRFAYHRALAALGRTDQAKEALEHAYRHLITALADLTPEARLSSLERVSAHREILAVWEAIHFQREVVRLPQIEAPTGRPLRDTEFVNVTWTLFAPEDNTVLDKSERRQAQLERLMREAGHQGASPTVDDLAQALGASRATIKRDLAALRRSGGELRTRGTRVTDLRDQGGVLESSSPLPLEISVRR